MVAVVLKFNDAALTGYGQSTDIVPVAGDSSITRKAVPAQQGGSQVQAMVEQWCQHPGDASIPAIDEELNRLLPEARRQASEVTDFQPWEVARHRQAYHDAGAVLMAKCVVLFSRDEVEAARPCANLLIEKLPYSMLLRNDGTESWNRSALRFREHQWAIYHVLKNSTSGEGLLGPERDEFDGVAQREAVLQMAETLFTMRDFEAVDRWVEMAASQPLHTSAGERVIDLIYEGMQPVKELAGVEANWRKMGDDIREWQRKKPGSLHAKAAEAWYLDHWAMHDMETIGRAGEKVYEEKGTKGLQILLSLPADDPTWYLNAATLICESQKDPSKILGMLLLGISKFPDDISLQSNMCNLASAASISGEARPAEMIQKLIGSGQPALAGKVMLFMQRESTLPEVIPYLPTNKVETGRTMMSVLAKSPGSLQLRNDVACMAYALGDEPLARQAMAGLAGKWSRTTWKGREEVAARLCLEK